MARRDAYQLEHFDEDCRNRFYWRHFVTRFFHLSLKIETADSSSGRISGWVLSLKLKSVKTFAAICWAIFFQPQRPSEKWIVLRYIARYQRDFASGKGVRWGEWGGRDKIAIYTVKAHEARQPKLIGGDTITSELCRWLSKHIFPKRRAFPVLAASEFRGVKQTTDR